MAFVLGFRQKLIAPTLGGLAAMLVAVAVAYGISRSAAVELHRVEDSHLPALALAQDLEAGFAARQRALQDAAASEDASMLAPADGQQARLRRRLSEAPPNVMAHPARDALLADLEAYAALSRSATLGLIAQRTDERQASALREMTDTYARLGRRLDEGTAAARAAVSSGLERARRLQANSILVAAAMLGGAGVFALGLALALARTVTGPVVRLNAAARKIAQGDLTGEIEVRGSDEIAALAGNFSEMTGRLRAVVSTLKEASVALEGAATRLSDSTRAQVAILGRAAAGVAETGVTTRELEQAAGLAASRAASVLDVATRAASLSATGHAAAEGSAEGIRVIQASVQGIAEGGGRLLAQARVAGEVVETVRELAARSHVLSINASLEATRAGEAGKGFGVVATEVRALAEQSGQGAERIARIVKDIQAAIQATIDQTAAGTRGVEGSASRIRASGESLRGLGGIVSETGEAAREIASAVQQQSVGIAQIAAAMRDLDGGMTESVERLRTVQTSADELLEIARQVAGIASEFRLE